MTDIMSKEKRSYLMSTIKGKNTTIELLVKKELKRRGIKFKMHPDIPGKPDFILPKCKMVIFCDGDFWHGKDYRQRKGKLSKYWAGKIKTNMQRDKKVNIMLATEGWHVARLWESDIRNHMEVCMKRILLACKKHKLKYR